MNRRSFFQAAATGAAAVLAAPVLALLPSAPVRRKPRELVIDAGGGALGPTLLRHALFIAEVEHGEVALLDAGWAMSDRRHHAIGCYSYGGLRIESSFWHPPDHVGLFPRHGDRYLVQIVNLALDPLWYVPPPLGVPYHANPATSREWLGLGPIPTLRTGA